MTNNKGSYGDFWRDLESHASNLAGSRVTHSTFKKSKQITRDRHTDRQTYRQTDRQTDK